ncbi:MAG: MarR family transcriptional regulator [Candidatus Omnitrophica bacterium]|nr:MarR family transcriptional regulator [Candidatus Omnitrophota bacterium]
MKDSFVNSMAKYLPHFMRVFGRKIINAAPKDLSSQHVLVIEMLKDKNVCQMKDVAGVLGVAMSTATALIDRMVETNYVKRAADTNDRRVVLIHLTSKAQKISTLIDKVRSETVKKVYSVLTSDEQDTLLALIKKVVEHIENEHI